MHKIKLNNHKGMQGSVGVGGSEKWISVWEVKLLRGEGQKVTSLKGSKLYLFIQYEYLFGIRKKSQCKKTIQIELFFLNPKYCNKGRLKSVGIVHE